jgi:hypothetical protein
MSKQPFVSKEEFINKAVMEFNTKFKNLKEKFLGKIYKALIVLEYTVEYWLGSFLEK